MARARTSRDRSHNRPLPRSEKDLDEAGLTREAVLDVAMQLIEEDGVTALSMRRLAGRLGVGTPTIYWHVGNREALLEGLVARVVNEIDVDQPKGRTPKERLMAVARSLRRELLARPMIMELLARAGQSDQVFTPARDACLREVRDAGLGGADAVLVMRGLLVHVVGFVLVERSLTAYRPSRRRRTGERGVGGLPVHPELAKHMSRLDRDELFSFTLGCLLDASLPSGAQPHPRRRGAAPRQPKRPPV